MIGEEGLLDRRRGPDARSLGGHRAGDDQARVFQKGLRIRLTNGDRYDIELNLLAAEPAEVMRLIQEQAGRLAQG